MCGDFCNFAEMKEKLLGMTLQELKEAAVKCGLIDGIGGIREALSASVTIHGKILLLGVL